MDRARILSTGVGAWLQYEYECNRSRLFSERYLSVPIAQILGAEYGLSVHVEYLHPVLARETKGRGRHPEVDFVAGVDSGTVVCAVESK